MISVKKQNEAFELLKNYEGNNPYLIRLKKSVYVNHNIDAMGSYQVEYILKNYNFEPKEINKIVKIADWYGEKKKEDWDLDFIPKVLKITTFLGETETTYNCYVQYKKSVPPVMCFLPKNGVLTNFLVEDYNKLEVDFERYNKLSNYQRILFDHQKDAIKFLLSRKKCILADDMGLGKMEPNSNLIPTPNGFKKMGKINIGDEVIGEDGNFYKVTQIFPHKNKEIYKVTFNDGTYSYCGLEHLWKVRTPVMRVRHQKWATKSLKEMIDSGLQYNNKSRVEKGYKKINKYEIPVTLPVSFKEKEYFIDPYILGICIGDGSLCNGKISISIPDIEIETKEKILSLLKKGYTLSENRSASCPRYLIKKINKGGINEYNRDIKRLGLNVKGNNKFIPEEYKIGSIEQRLSLLRGLMDSDGSIENGNKIGYYTNSYNLAKDVQELVNSLGGIARIHSYDRRKEGKNIEYHVFIQIKENPFSLKRKSEKYEPTYKKYCSRYIVSAEFDHIEDATCIMVDYDKHTYLTGRNYIVTHNTTSLTVAAIEGNFDSVLIICPASLKSNWKRELSFYIPEKDITVIEGFADKNKGELEEFLGYAQGKSKMTRAELLEEAKEQGEWKFNRFIIINYDILDKFFTNKRTYTKEQFDDLVNNSPLLQYINNRKSLLILDEAHVLSDSKSNRYKLIKGLINKGKPDSIFLATGTLITNNAANLYCVLNFLGESITSDWQYYMKRYCAAEEFCKDRKERDKWSNKFIQNKKKSSWYDLTKSEKEELNEYLHQHCKYILVPKGDSNLDELKERISHIYLRREKNILTLPKKTVHEIYYDLSVKQQMEYEKLWEEYEAEKMQEDPNKEINKDLLEGAIYRQYLSTEMVPNTIQLAQKFIDNKEKIVIACCYDEELYKFQEYYGDKCVIYNGKLSLKQKDEAIAKFISNPDVLVFVGNIKAAGVGITLIASHILIFNDFDYVPGNNQQMSDRVHRIGQQHPVDIYYQIFKSTQYEKMWKINERKQIIIDTVIKTEDEKMHF